MEKKSSPQRISWSQPQRVSWSCFHGILGRLQWVLKYIEVNRKFFLFFNKMKCILQWQWGDIWLDRYIPSCIWSMWTLFDGEPYWVSAESLNRLKALKFTRNDAMCPIKPEMHIHQILYQKVSVIYQSWCSNSFISMCWIHVSLFWYWKVKTNSTNNTKSLN